MSQLDRVAGAETVTNGSAPVPQHPFLKEALEFAQTKQYGTVLLARPVSHSVFTGLFCVLAALIVVFLFTFSTTRKATAQGVLLPVGGVVKVNLVNFLDSWFL